MFLSVKKNSLHQNKSGEWGISWPLGFGLSFLLAINVIVDQISKVIAEKKLMVWSSDTDLKSYQGLREPLGTIGSLVDQGAFYVDFAFTYVRNQGAAWGFLSDMPDPVRIPFFYIVSFVAIGMILNYLRMTPLHHKLARFSLSLILSGAIGNLLDRIRLGYVIDFLDVRWSIPFGRSIDIDVDWFPSYLSFLNFKIHTMQWAYDFPKFNWADSCITVGVICLMIHMLFFEVHEK